MKKLVLVSGPPGVGKSTLARKLAEKYSFVYLDKDIVDEPFSPNDRGEKYSKEIEPKVLEALLGLAEINLKLGQSCLLDAPWSHILFYHRDLKAKIQSLANDTNSRLVVFEITLPEVELKERIEKRGLDRDRVKLTESGWKLFVQTDRVGQKIDLPHEELDGRGDPESMFDQACSRIPEL